MDFDKCFDCLSFNPFICCERLCFCLPKPGKDVFDALHVFKISLLSNFQSFETQKIFLPELFLHFVLALVLLVLRVCVVVCVVL